MYNTQAEHNSVANKWRSYLNMRGCEEEGLYRVPGSAQQVRYYERKFDEGMFTMSTINVRLLTRLQTGILI